ncbi:hypothetical protein [Flavilitoribacter nigricans]
MALTYSYAGNIWELKNIIERAKILTEGSTLNLSNWQDRPTGEVEHHQSQNS